MNDKESKRKSDKEKLEVYDKPVGDCLRPARTHTQTDGQPVNIMPPFLSSGTETKKDKDVSNK